MCHRFYVAIIAIGFRTQVFDQGKMAIIYLRVCNNNKSVNCGLDSTVSFTFNFLFEKSEKQKHNAALGCSTHKVKRLQFLSKAQRTV